VTFVLDTNLFIYAIDPEDQRKHAVARKLVNRWLSQPTRLPRQVLGEILNLGHKRRGPRLQLCRELVALLEDAAEVVPTTRAFTLAASARAERFQLQYWDALICEFAARDGIDVILTEDMHDGLAMASLRVVNPFNPANDAKIAGLIDA
jgi:predicted nucleic acid-binding protein